MIYLFLSAIPFRISYESTGETPVPLFFYHEGLRRRQGRAPLAPSFKLTHHHSALERPVAPFFSLITAWAAAMRAMGIRMGEQDT